MQSAHGLEHLGGKVARTMEDNVYNYNHRGNILVSAWAILGREQGASTHPSIDTRSRGEC